MKKPTILQSLTPIVFLICLIALNISIFGNDTLSGANQIALIFASTIAALIALYNKTKWDKIMETVVENISTSMSAILILLLIGMLAGTWMTSGVIPSMMYYGLNIINADFFLPAAVIIAIVISLAVGSSWSTIATIGVALLGIGRALGFDDGIIAGAIISGAYFGDKLSPVSDTSNLSAAVAKTDLFVVIKYMMYTSIPSILITLLIFIGISLFSTNEATTADISSFQNGLENTYNITPWLFLVPLLTIVGIAKQLPAIPVLLFGSLFGGVATIVFQPEIITSLSTDGLYNAKSCYEVVSKSMFGPIKMVTEDPVIAELTSTKGMIGMLNTIWLILCAMTFGGILEAAGFLNRLTESLMSSVKSPKGLITATTGTAVLFNLTAGDQYLSIVIPGKMFATAYDKFNLKGEVLARTLQDSATTTSVLVPWNTCGATQSSILGVATIQYVPFAFFCYLSPLFSILYAWFNIKIRRKDDK